MQIIQSRRDFLAGASFAAAAGVLGGRGSLADEGPLETTAVRLTSERRHLHRASVPGRRAAARGRLHRCPLRAGHEGTCGRQNDRTRRGRLHLHFRRFDRAPDSMRANRSRHSRAYTRLLRAVRQRACPHHRRPEGQDASAYLPFSSSPHCTLECMAGTSGSTLIGTSTGSRVAKSTPMELFAAGKVDAFLGFPPEPQELRTRGIGRVILNTGNGAAVVAILLLHVLGNRDYVHDHPVATKRVLRALLKSIDFCAAEPVRAAQRLVDGGFADRIRLRGADPERGPLRLLARVRPRGLDAVLCAASARGRHDQVKPQPNPRRGHRLALPQRAQARAEGMRQGGRADENCPSASTIRKGGFRCRSFKIGAISWSVLR